MLIIREVTRPDMTAPPTLSGTTTCGLKVCRKRRKVYLASTRIRITFRAPPVEPAEAPMTISTSSTERARVGQVLKSAVL